MTSAAYYGLVIVAVLLVGASFVWYYAHENDITYEEASDYTDTLISHRGELTTDYNVVVDLSETIDNTTLPYGDSWAVSVHYTIGVGITDMEVYPVNWSIAIYNDTLTDVDKKMSMDINQTFLNTSVKYSYRMVLEDEDYTDAYTISCTKNIYCDRVVFILVSKNYANPAEYHMTIEAGGNSELININVQA